MDVRSLQIPVQREPRSFRRSQLLDDRPSSYGKAKALREILEEVGR